MPRELERVFIFYQGAEPAAGEVEAIMHAVVSDADVDPVGARITTVESRYSEPDPDTAMAFIARLERDGGLSSGAVGRMMTQDLTVNGKRRIIVMIPAARGGNPTGDNPLLQASLVRKLISKHMERVDDHGASVAWLPGWATLGSEAAISFASTAHDGEMHRFDDVHVVVSHMPETDPQRIRQLMSGSYVTWVDTVPGFLDLLNNSDVDIAHWILCADRTTHAVHLGYFALTVRGALMPTDLIPPDNQQDTQNDEIEARRRDEPDGRVERELALDDPDLPLVHNMVRARSGDPDATAAVRATIDADRRRWGAPTAPYASALEVILKGVSTQAMMDNDLTASQAATLYAIVDALTNAAS